MVYLPFTIILEKLNDNTGFYFFPSNCIFLFNDSNIIGKILLGMIFLILPTIAIIELIKDKQERIISIIFIIF